MSSIAIAFGSCQAISSASAPWIRSSRRSIGSSGGGLDHAAVEGDHAVALDPDDAEAEVGGAGVDAHHDLHGK